MAETITPPVQLATIPPAQIRESLHEAVVNDLLGPAEGPEEEILGMSVRDRYLVGKLAPRNVRVGAEEQDEMSQEANTNTNDGASDGGPAANESLMPSSFGLTFCVDANVQNLDVSASWGRYQKVESQIHMTDQGRGRRVWKRTPAGGTVTLPLAPGLFGPLNPDPAWGDVYIRGIVRPATAAGEIIITLFLVNEQEAPETNQDEAWLFQSELRAQAPDGSPIFRRRPSTEADTNDPERAALAMLYRGQVEFAVGHGVSVHHELVEGRTDRAVSVRTQVIPSYDVPVTEPPTSRDIPGFADLVLDMRTLSELDRASLTRNLTIVVTEYGAWITRQQERTDRGEVEGHGTAARDAVANCRRTMTRLEEGIRVLETNDQAFEAFRFANRAMWMQRIHSIYALRRRRGQESTLEAIDIPENRSWRPFQLAFFLLAIPGLSDPHHHDRNEEATAIADLLWFPTGGGKTEAYLGVAAFTMAIRRLQGMLGGLDGTRGVAVIMRYTLRLLTLQQFQRASTLMCAMEVIRRTAQAAGDTRWGSTPFRIGLWVGEKATPNRTEDAQQAIQNAHGDGWQRTGTGTPAQLTSCPWCGSQLVPGRDITVRPFRGNIGRTLMFCSDQYGRCEFTAAQAPDEGLPVVVVDEEIYRLLPALLVGTVDKFAQMPWKGEVQTLFGRVSGYCQRHGFLSPDAEDTGNHNRAGALPRVARQDASTLRPPDLIIQDELHLISGPLGTMVGLYETAVDELCKWSYDGREVRPKVIASTATVRKAPEQVHNVFMRRVAIFLPHGLDASDNFFALQRPVTPEIPGRRYMGICAPGQSRPAVLIRVYVAFLTAAKNLYDLHGVAADPWMTLIGYFNSLRELGGMRRLAEDDVRTRAFRVTLGEVQRPGLAQRDVRNIAELTSRASSGDIPRILDNLEASFPPPGQEPPVRPYDIVLATNMVSVGVDVQRLGLMIVNGQPKTTAEYIQATSRVGRRFPGMVCTVLNWSKPRDLSHYETYEHYHATFYQHVEAQSVTPFAPRAADRGLTGVLASMLRLEDLVLNPNSGAGDLRDRTHPHAMAATTGISGRAWGVTQRADARDLVNRMLDYRVDEWVREAQRGGRNLGYKTRRDNDTVGLLKSPGSAPWDHLTAPTSMREVEPGVSLIMERNIRGGATPDWRPAAPPDNDQGGGE